MKLIPLTQGKFAKVDDEDLVWLVLGVKWQYVSSGYAIHHRYKQPDIRMHRLIMGAGPGQQVDHLNGDRLDNQRANLRIATSAQNNQNRRLPSNNSSGFKGVRWSREMKKWRAEIGTPPNRRHLGYYDNIFDAAHCYNQAAIELFGEFAYLNEV